MAKVKDGRRNNGRTKEELQEIGQDGLARVTHGGYTWLSRGFAKADDNCELYPECKCDQRCLAIDRMAAEIETELMSLPHIEPCDLFLVRNFCKLMVFQIVVDRFLERHGIITEKGAESTFLPVFKDYFVIGNSLQRLGDRLGLSPIGRKQLKSKGGLSELGKALSKIASERDKK